MAALYAVAAGFVLVLNTLRTVGPALPGHVTRLGTRFSVSVMEAPSLYVPIQFAVAIGFSVALLMMMYVAWLIAVGLVSFALLREVREFRPVVAILRAVRACGGVYGTVGPQRTATLQELAASMSLVRRELGRAHRVRGSLLRRGSRVALARDHARHVVAGLDAAEARLDVEGDPALPSLVMLLDQIADRYADGRLGSLLDEEMLKVPEGRDWEALRLAALSVVIGLGALGAGLLALSDPATAVLIVSVGVLGVAMIYRRNLSKGTSLLELWKP